MKKILVMTIVACALVACAGCNKKNNTGGNTTASNGTKDSTQLNISILLDLSDRIDPTMNPEIMGNDTANIGAITRYFTTNMESLNAYKAKGKIRAFLVPPPSDPKINSIVSELNIDCSNMTNEQKKKVHDTLTALYKRHLSEIYKKTIADKSWVGSDIWRFFKDDAKAFCIDNNKGYRNILVIFTDGYLYHEQSMYNKGNRFSYLLGEKNLKPYRNQNYEELIDKNDFGVMTELKDLGDLEVLVLGIKANDPRHKTDEDILKSLWGKWLSEMGVKHYAVYPSNLPAYTKKHIDNFLSNQ